MEKGREKVTQWETDKHNFSLQWSKVNTKKHKSNWQCITFDMQVMKTTLASAITFSKNSPADLPLYMKSIRTIPLRDILQNPDQYPIKTVMAIKSKERLSNWYSQEDSKKRKN